MLKEWITANRSYRRFEESSRIAPETLLELAELARLTGSAANLQPLRFLPIHTPEGCARVFPALGWAGYLKDWEGPKPGERPAAYLLLFADRQVSQNAQLDAGLAAQSILLGAVERKLGGCMLGNVRRGELMESLGIDPERYELLLVIALGVPAERVTIEPMPADGDIRYWRDEAGGHHVPKRALEDLLLSAKEA
ncbi:MAG: nitroreductase family protein [Provencibacterium sp.]|jgi:nitroreductase|nr:nitroreductase family protein [Provencibacterium sp.]